MMKSPPRDDAREAIKSQEIPKEDALPSIDETIPIKNDFNENFQMAVDNL